MILSIVFDLPDLDETKDESTAVAYMRKQCESVITQLEFGIINIPEVDGQIPIDFQEPDGHELGATSGRSCILFRSE